MRGSGCGRGYAGGDGSGMVGGQAMAVALVMATATMEINE